MKCLQSSRKNGGATDATTLRLVLNAIATVGQKAQPEIFAHVQPHAHATANLTRRFVAACGYAERCHMPTLKEVEIGAYMHDIGKYFIAPSVLLKPGELDAEERAAVSLHSSLGAIALAKLPSFTKPICQIVLHHHEHWDGTGYPDGLSGTRIPFAARLVAVIDVYTSLRARRAYKPTLKKHEAFNILTEMAGRELDPCLVEDFLRLICDKEQR